MTLDSLEGDLQHLRLSRVLFLLGSQDANGILTVQGEDDIVAVSFVQGAIVTADALNQTVEDGLGKVLQGKGWMTPEAFQSAAREHQGGSAGSLGELLVEKGNISRQQLLEALRLQTLRSMFQLLTWRSGELKFYSGDEVSFEQGFVPIGVDELLLRALNKLGEKAGLQGSMPNDQATYRTVPPRGAVRILGRDGNGMEAGIWLSPLQAEFLARVTGNVSTPELSRSLGLSRQQLLFTLYHLLQHDLIEEGGHSIGRAAKPMSHPGGTGATPVVEPASGLGFAEPSGAVAKPSPMAPPGPLGTTVGRSDPSGTAIQLPDSGISARQSDVLIPPDPDEIMRRGSTSVETDGQILNWSGVALGVVLLLSLLVAVMARPARLLLPFPWQENARNTVERHVRESVFHRIDLSARTFFLMEAHYPDSLEQIKGLSLIAGVDTQDPAGHQLQYEADVVSYSIGLVEKGEEIEGLGTTEAITGDFLVDPQFLGTATTAEDPVVLLD